MRGNAATATCSGKKKKAVAGGYQAEYPTTPGDDEVPIVTQTSIRSGNGAWSVAGQIPDGDQTRQLTAYAYCAKKKRTEVMAGGTGAGDGTVAQILSPECEKGSPLSGGFRVGPFRAPRGSSAAQCVNWAASVDPASARVALCGVIAVATRSK